MLKPIIYMTALESGRYNLASSVDDSPITVNLNDGNDWNPKNYDNRDHGYVPFTTALSQSYNQATVRLGMEFGVNTFAKQLQRMGIKEKNSALPISIVRLS
nr:penicillin-binding transpeptidase domain-containing protein [Psychrobacter sp. JCM 18900]